jgi:hypothetical protein
MARPAVAEQPGGTHSCFARRPRSRRTIQQSHFRRRNLPRDRLLRQRKGPRAGTEGGTVCPPTARHERHQIKSSMGNECPLTVTFLESP